MDTTKLKNAKYKHAQELARLYKEVKERVNQLQSHIAAHQQQILVLEEELKELGELFQIEISS